MTFKWFGSDKFLHNAKNVNIAVNKMRIDLFIGHGAGEELIIL